MTTTGLARPALRMTGAIVLIAAVAVLERMVIMVNATTVALSFLLAVLVVATTWGLVEAIAASILAMLCFNYFFLPPLGALTISDPENWVALVAFLVTAAVASQLSNSARQRAEEAMRRQREMEKLYDLSRSLLLLDSKSGVAGQVALQIAQVFGLPAVAVFDRAGDQLITAGGGEIAVSDVALRDAALQGTASEDAAARVSIVPLLLGGLPIGSLAVASGSMSDTALHSVANLAAITMERGRAQAVALRAEAARQNQVLKSTLLDALAHEFKTPLTSIKAAVTGMLDSPGAPAAELLGIVEEETDHLDSLVNEAIQMARIEAGQVQLNRRPEQVTELVVGALRTAGRAIQDRDVRVEIADGLPDVLVDRDLMQSVIRHLVDNSRKYASPGSPIEVRAWSEGKNIIVAVKDQGPGIPAREQMRIFERFYRSPASSTAAPGTGMGLAIARDIVEAHDGTLDVRSRPGEGSEFFFRIPVASAGVRA